MVLKKDKLVVVPTKSNNVVWHRKEFPMKSKSIKTAISENLKEKSSRDFSQMSLDKQSEAGILKEFS